MKWGPSNSTHLVFPLIETQFEQRMRVWQACSRAQTASYMPHWDSFKCVRMFVQLRFSSVFVCVCVCVKGVRARSWSAADEWEIIRELQRDGVMSSLDGCVLQPRYEPKRNGLDDLSFCCYEHLLCGRWRREGFNFAQELIRSDFNSEISLIHLSDHYSKVFSVVLGLFSHRMRCFPCTPLPFQTGCWRCIFIDSTGRPWQWQLLGDGNRCQKVDYPSAFYWLALIVE